MCIRLLPIPPHALQDIPAHMTLRCPTPLLPRLCDFLSHARVYPVTLLQVHMGMPARSVHNDYYML
jgi:hypothetical protein